jgi:hypothetical protein
MNQIFPLLLTFALLAACASHHPGKAAEAAGPDNVPGLRMSAEVIAEHSDEVHKMIVFTFQNTDPDWRRYKSAQVSFGEATDAVTNIILGEDLSAWVESQRIKRLVEQHNNGLLYAGGILLGTAMAITGANSGKTGLGVAGLGVAGTAMAANAVDLNRRSLLRTKVGDFTGHIYHPFSVPAGGLTKKWLLVHTPKKHQLKELILTLETIDGEVEAYALTID